MTPSLHRTLVSLQGTLQATISFLTMCRLETIKKLFFV